MSGKTIPIDHLRHSLAHLLASAVLEMFPGAKLGVGPVIESGFFYDFLLPRPITPEDLKILEKRMRKLVGQRLPFERMEMTTAQAKKFFSAQGGSALGGKELNQPFKVELIEDIEKFGTTKASEILGGGDTPSPPAPHAPGEGGRRPGEGQKVSLYKTGKFIDLCRGGHVENTSEIDARAFQLWKISGAYWRGDEKRPQLQRIYGLAFASEQELKEHLTMLSEAEKRDHRKLGTQLGLLMFHETSPGMPYWLPKGMIVLNELINFWRVEHAARGYHEISSPLINKKELWETSGHWEHYKDNMFIADIGEGEVYAVKAMNCPNAMLVFASEGRSYRDLPLRLSDTDILHRYERSGTLSGLLRARSFRQDDSHNFVTQDQIEREYGEIFEIVKRFYGIFGLSYTLRLGTRPAKYMGDLASWNKAEDALKRILDKKVGKGKYLVLEGDGAFYGPKIDILMKDAIGREWQMGTIQLDFQQPKRFNLIYTDQDGQKKTPVVVHRVIYGSLERFIGILIEHFAGAFPVWLSPVQVYVAPVGKAHYGAARKLGKLLSAEGLRVEVDEARETIPYKVRKAEKQKVPYILVVGDREKSLKKLTVRIRGQEKQPQMTLSVFIKRVRKEIETRR